MAEITLGIDVSMWQGQIDWQTVADETDYVFAFIKATESVTHVDTQFRENWVGAKAAGFLCGPYHFARVDKKSKAATHAEDASHEADHFYATIRANDYGASDLDPVVDIESHGIGSTNPDIVVEWLSEFLWRMKVLSGRSCIVYTGKSTWMFKFAQSKEFFDYALWQADYRPTLHAIKEWEASFWQYGTKGAVPGIKTKRVDKNKFFGTKEQLAKRFTLNAAAALAELATRYLRRPAAEFGQKVLDQAKKVPGFEPAKKAATGVAGAVADTVTDAVDAASNFVGSLWN